LFPAGTLTGAPQVRAMELIDDFDPVFRGPYGGAVGYFSLSGNADFAITIPAASSPTASRSSSTRSRSTRRPLHCSRSRSRTRSHRERD
jgi:hypothetical protein